MQESLMSEELQPRPSGGISKAYGQVMRQTESPRDMEYRVFSQITAAMEALPPNALSGQRAEIIQRNRTLWDQLGWAVTDDANQLPVALRSNIAGIAMWVKRECSRVLRENAGLEALIEINKIIMAGLRPSGNGGS